MTTGGAGALAEEFSALRNALSGITSMPSSQFSLDEVQGAVQEFHRFLNEAEAVKLHLLRQLTDRSRTVHDAVDFLTTAPRNLTRAQATKDVELARMTDPDVDWDGRIGGLDGDRGCLQLLGAQLAAGVASRAHLDLARAAVQSLPTTVRRGTLSTYVDVGDDRPGWRTNVKSRVLDGFFATEAVQHAPGALKQLTGEMLDLLDPDRSDRGADPDGQARRNLRWSRVNGMQRLTVDLDEASAVVVRQAVRACSAPLPLDPSDPGPVTDSRSQGQREHDGLVDLVQVAVAAAAPAVRENAQVLLHVTVDQLTARPGAGAAIADGHGALGSHALDVLSCDATVRAVVLDRAGVPLALTSLARAATTQQRAVLAARDRGCLAPGCGAPTWLCHAHHVRFWRDGGPTEVTNMALLCGRHHRQLHAGLLEVRFAADGRPEARWIRGGPDWRVPGPWSRNDYPASAARARAVAQLLRDDGNPPRAA